MNCVKHLPAATLCLLLATGCTAENEGTDGLPVPLTFSTSVGTQTRTDAGLTTDNLTSAGVFAYLTNGDFSASASTPGFMYNQKLERADNATPWTYSPMKFWPNNPAEKLTFFAYAPYVDETVAGGSNPALQEKTTAAGFPTLTYTVPAAEADQTDLLASVPLMNRTYGTSGGTGGSGKVSFAMNHVLTKVGIFIKSKDNETSKKVTAFSITSAASGTLTFHAPANGSDTGTGWNGITGTQTFVPTNARADIPANTTTKFRSEHSTCCPKARAVRSTSPIPIVGRQVAAAPLRVP